MDKFLIRLVLLILPIAALSGGAPAMPGAYDTCRDRSADIGCQVEPPATNVLECLHPAVYAGGFPFCATNSILRWRETPVHKVRASPPAGRWL
jgi:hypothetical protein